VVAGRKARVRAGVVRADVPNPRCGLQRASLFQLALSLLIHRCVIEPEAAKPLLPGILATEQERQFSTMLGTFMSQVAAVA
jgi:hypothetical protein